MAPPAAGRMLHGSPSELQKEGSGDFLKLEMVLANERLEQLEPHSASWVSGPPPPQSILSAVAAKVLVVQHF